MNDLTEEEIIVLTHCGEEMYNCHGDKISNVVILHWVNTDTNKFVITVNKLSGLINKGYIIEGSSYSHITFTKKGLEVIKLLSSYERL